MQLSWALLTLRLPSAMRKLLLLLTAVEGGDTGAR